MSGCHIKDERLQQWLDGELAEGAERDALDEHIEDCSACVERLDAWRISGEFLREVVDAGVGEVEPLLALQVIRERIAKAEEKSLGNRLKVWWQDLWAFNRRAVAGLAAAAAMGAVSAPALVYWVGVGQHDSNGVQGPMIASVVVESLEFDGEVKAVVYRPQGDSNTTIIWTEPDDDENGREAH